MMVQEVRRDRAYRVSLALHAAVAERLKEDPERVRSIGMANIPRVRENVSGLANEWVDEWQELLAGPTEAIHDALLRDDEHGADMRSATPFATVITQEERVRAILSAADPE